MTENTIEKSENRNLRMSRNRNIAKQLAAQYAQTNMEYMTLLAYPAKEWKRINKEKETKTKLTHAEHLFVLRQIQLEMAKISKKAFWIDFDREQYTQFLMEQMLLGNHMIDSRYSQRLWAREQAAERNKQLLSEVQ